MVGMSKNKDEDKRLRDIQRHLIKHIEKEIQEGDEQAENEV